MKKIFKNMQADQLMLLIRKMKDEYCGVIIDEFVRLKSKIYSIKKIDGS